jgi:hypothetical protein
MKYGGLEFKESPAFWSIGTAATPFYHYHNETYRVDHFSIPSNLQCVANGSYQWVFSSGAILFFVAVNSLWIIGTYGIWVHLNRKSLLCRIRSLGKI